MRVAVTGHRPQHLSLEDGYWIQGEFERLIDKIKPTSGISGLALGADTWWAAACLNAKIPLYAYVPFKGQELRWRSDDQIFYRSLIEQCEDVRYFGERYDVRLYHARDRAMVDDCDMLIAAWNGKQSGGTWATFEYAMKVQRKTVRVDPVRRVVTLLRPEQPVAGPQTLPLGG